MTHSILVRCAKSVFGLCTAGLCLWGCTSFERLSLAVPKVITPYSMDIVQGNVVTSEQLASLQLGMPRTQVQSVLGTPLLVSPFHAQRWDYAFTFKRQGVAPQERHVTVFFKDERLERIEADSLPSEAEFVSSLRKPIDLAEPKPLQASDDALAKYPPPSARVASPASAVPSVSSYPPLEAPAK